MPQENLSVSEQPYTLPDGRKTTKGNFYFGMMHYGIGRLVEYHERFLKLQQPTLPPHRENMSLDNIMEYAIPPILPNGYSSIKDLSSIDAAWTLHLLIDSAETYQQTLATMKYYAQRNSDLGVLIEVTEDRVNALLDRARHAPPEVLKRTTLDAFLTPATV